MRTGPLSGIRSVNSDILSGEQLLGSVPGPDGFGVRANFDLREVRAREFTWR